MAEKSELSPEQQVLSEAMAIHRNEARNTRLRALADSINDTARMARTTLTLALLVALYLGVTLLSSTDLNLFLNGQVVLPQVGVGVSVVQSYIFAPPVFVFLHAQALLLLTVLARKVRHYEGEVFKYALPDQRNSYREWLSGFGFVQVLQSYKFFSAPRLLFWIAAIIVPLVLLFLIDLSFIRYQSYEITSLHHFWFFVDFVCVWLFNQVVFGENYSTRLRGERVFVRGAQIAGLAMLLLLASQAWPPSFKGNTRAGLHQDGDSLFAWAGWLWTNTTNQLSVSGANFLRWTPRPETPGNFLDEGPCEWWSFGCRFLDVSRELLVKRQAEDRYTFTPADTDNAKLVDLRRSHVEALDLRQRTFRFARFSEAYAPRLILISADLRGASGDNSDLSGAILSNAKLQGVYFQKTKLHNSNLAVADFQRANLTEAELQGAILGNSDLREADLSNAILRGANLSNAKLQGANLTNAELQGANLERSALQGADINNADLQSADLSYASLHGANLRSANLQVVELWRAALVGADLRRANLTGANLEETKLQGAFLEGAQLQGANLYSAQLQGAYGRPAGWGLAWMSGARFGFAPLTDQPEGGTLLQRAEHELSQIVTDEMRAQKLRWRSGDVSVADEVRERFLEGVTRGVFEGYAPAPSDLIVHDHNDAVFQPAEPPTTPEVWPPSADAGDPAYWQAWAEWTVPFACGSEHTARSSLGRWGTMRDGPMKETVRAALIAKRESGEECPGLKAIPEAEWQRFVEGR